MMDSFEVLARNTGGPTMNSPRTDAEMEEQSMNNDLKNRTGVSAPLTSRRRFIRAASAASGAGMLAAGLVPIRAQESAKKAPLIVLPAATKDVTPFKVHVPQAALDDLKKRLTAARWPDGGSAT